MEQSRTDPQSGEHAEPVPNGRHAEPPNGQLRDGAPADSPPTDSSKTEPHETELHGPERYEPERYEPEPYEPEPAEASHADPSSDATDPGPGSNDPEPRPEADQPQPGYADPATGSPSAEADKEPMWPPVEAVSVNKPDTPWTGRPSSGAGAGAVGSVIDSPFLPIASPSDDPTERLRTGFEPPTSASPGPTSAPSWPPATPTSGTPESTPTSGAPGHGPTSGAPDDEAGQPGTPPSWPVPPSAWAKGPEPQSDEHGVSDQDQTPPDHTPPAGQPGISVGTAPVPPYPPEPPYPPAQPYGTEEPQWSEPHAPGRVPAPPPGVSPGGHPGQPLPGPPPGTAAGNPPGQPPGMAAAHGQPVHDGPPPGPYAVPPNLPSNQPPPSAPPGPPPHLAAPPAQPPGPPPGFNHGYYETGPHPAHTTEFPAVPQSHPDGGHAPTAEEFALRRAVRPPDPVAQMGVRKALRRSTLGLVRMGPGRKEQEYINSIETVRRNFGGLRQVTVVNPKGGAGKTVAVLMVAMTFGQKRGGYVLAWDNNETQGTLGMRAQQDFHNRTVRDMLRDLDHFRGPTGRVGDLSQYVRSQGEAMFDVLASDESATAGEMLTANAFRDIREVVSRFYKLIIVDTGNNVRAQNWQAAIDATDQLVVTMSARNDSAETAARMLDHLEQTGRHQLVRRAVTVVSMPPSRKDIDLPAIQRHFSARTRSVLLAPYEGLIDSGEPIRYSLLSQASRDAWLKIGSAVAEGL